MVHWQGHVRPGTRTMAMVQWIDILPTLVDVAGGRPDSSLDGRSFRNVLEGRETKHRDEVLQPIAMMEHECLPMPIDPNRSLEYIRICILSFVTQPTSTGPRTSRA